MSKFIDVFKSNPSKTDPTTEISVVNGLPQPVTLPYQLAGFTDEEKNNYKQIADTFYLNMSKQPVKPTKSDTSKVTRALLKNKNGALIIAYKEEGTNKENFILFKDYFEAPIELPITRIKEGPTFKYPGGIQSNQIMGSFVEPIEWKGTLRGEDALIRFTELKKIFNSDNPVTVIYKTSHNLRSNDPNNTSTSWFRNSNNITIEEHNAVIKKLKMIHRHQNDITYEIQLNPHEDLTKSVIGLSPAFEELSVLVEEIATQTNPDGKKPADIDTIPNQLRIIDQQTRTILLNSSALYNEATLKKYNSKITSKSCVGTARATLIENIEYKNISFVPALSTGFVVYFDRVIDNDPFKNIISGIPTHSVTSKDGKTTDEPVFRPTHLLVIQDFYTPGIAYKYYFHLEDDIVGKTNDLLVRDHLDSLCTMRAPVRVNTNLLPANSILPFNKYLINVVKRNYIDNIVKVKKNQTKILESENRSVWYHIEERFQMRLTGAFPVKDSFEISPIGGMQSMNIDPSVATPAIAAIVNSTMKEDYGVEVYGYPHLKVILNAKNDVKTIDKTETAEGYVEPIKIQSKPSPVSAKESLQNKIDSLTKGGSNVLIP